MENQNIHEVFGEVISTYTREQALEDGVLIDVTEQAKEAGFTIDGLFPGEIRATRELLAEEKKINIINITVAIEE